MKKLMKDAYSEAKSLPKGLWIAAIVVPGGILTLAAYLAGKSAYNAYRKEKKNDRSEDNQG